MLQLIDKLTWLWWYETGTKTGRIQIILWFVLMVKCLTPRENSLTFLNSKKPRLSRESNTVRSDRKPLLYRLRRHYCPRAGNLKFWASADQGNLHNEGFLLPLSTHARFLFREMAPPLINFAFMAAAKLVWSGSSRQASVFFNLAFWRISLADDVSWSKWRQTFDPLNKIPA